MTHDEDNIKSEATFTGSFAKNITKTVVDELLFSCIKKIYCYNVMI